LVVRLNELNAKWCSTLLKITTGDYMKLFDNQATGTSLVQVGVNVCSYCASCHHQSCNTIHWILFHLMRRCLERGEIFWLQTANISWKLQLKVILKTILELKFENILRGW
jgi:hypothetical protein